MAVEAQKTGVAQAGKLLGFAMWGVVCVHALQLVGVGPHSIALSRYLTTAAPILAAFACILRARRLGERERSPWFWSTAALLLWGIAHLVETVFSPSTAASGLTVNASDFIYLAGTFPLLIILSTTRETESLRAVFALNCVQICLAVFLSYYLLYQMALSPEAANTVMGRIYGTACILLCIMVTLRSFTWATEEERQSIRWLGLVLWTYMPVELGMDFATARWNLQAGTLLDLVWSIPFFVGGLQALRLPILPPDPEPRTTTSKPRLVVETLCPMLITAGVFALAASITRQHAWLGLSAIFILFAIQGIESAVVQLNYLAGRNLLLQQDRDLRLANEALRQMSLEDPLTHIANRRRFDAALEIAWRRGVRKHQPLSLLLIDVDFFKGVNDLHGHSYGDDCLVDIARRITEHARRPDDVAARLGGEEFVLLLPDTDSEGAKAVAHDLQAEIFALEIVNEASPFQKTLTVSVGIGHVEDPKLGVNPMSLVDCADQALYDAKHQGRNRTCTRALD